MFVSVSRKSDRSLIGAFLPDLFSEIYQFFRYLSYSSNYRSALPVPVYQFQYTSPRLSHFRFASHDILDLIENDSEFDQNCFLILEGDKVLFLFFSFAVSRTMETPFLDYVVRCRECIQSQFVKLSSGFTFNQELSAGAVDNSLIPTEKTLRTLHFWNCFA